MKSNRFHSYKLKAWSMIPWAGFVHSPFALYGHTIVPVKARSGSTAPAENIAYQSHDNQGPLFFVEKDGNLPLEYTLLWMI